MAGAWVVFPIAVVAGNGQDKRWPANERAREFACDVRDGKEKGGRDMNERQKILGLPRLPPPFSRIGATLPMTPRLNSESF